MLTQIQSVVPRMRAPPEPGSSAVTIQCPVCAIHTSISLPLARATSISYLTSCVV